MSRPCPAEGSLHILHTGAIRTLSATVHLHAEVSLFSDPEAIVARFDRAGFAGRDEDDILVGEATFALSFCDPMSVVEIGSSSAPDFATRFNDQAYFSPRAPGLAGGLSHFLTRMDAPLGEQSVCGLALLDQIECAPGFSPWDVFDASLSVLSTLVMTGSHDLLFLHSEVDIHDSQAALWKAMAEQNAFRRNQPQWKITTFPNIGPMAGTIAGLIPAGGAPMPRHGVFEIGCDLDMIEDPAAPDMEPSAG